MVTFQTTTSPARMGRRIRVSDGPQESQREDQRFAGVCLTQGSAGTLGCADYLREVFPGMKVVAAEAHHAHQRRK